MNKDSEILEQYQKSQLDKARNSDDEIASEDEDELLAQLENDDSLITKYRESRIQQLSTALKDINHTVKTTDSQDLGNVIEVSEKTLMDSIVKHPYSIIHFYQPNFPKCQIMNTQLQLLAENHLNLKIFKIKAEKAPFLVDKLHIQVLPFVVIYKSGQELDRLIGFEKLGNDKFNYDALELYLSRLRVIQRRSINRTIRKQQQSDSEESDLDL
ncbi:Phosducin-like protein 1 [Spathaspora sp. JA1]|nr:Phosducin-like protein 1 [Spathaspora sp. JA1]